MKITLIPSLLLMFAFSSLLAQDSSCGLVANGSFEEIYCPHPYSVPFESGCSGAEWRCYHNLPKLTGVLQANDYGPAADGDVFAVLYGSINQAIDYIDLNGDIEYGKKYNISFSVKSATQNGMDPNVTDPVRYDIYAYDSEFATLSCGTFPDLPYVGPYDSQHLAGGVMQPGGDWQEITLTEKINPFSIDFNPIAFHIVASSEEGDNTSNLGFDNFCIEEAPCEPFDCQEDSNLFTCTETNSMGYVHVDCADAVVYTWDLGGSNSAVTFKGPNGTALVNAGPGTYKLTILGPDDCTEEREYTIIEQCCDDNSCDIPTGLHCRIIDGVLTLNWQAMPQAVEYFLSIIPNDQDCMCASEPGNGMTFATTKTSVTVPSFFEDCFSWQVRAKCRNGSQSDFSEKECVSPHTECIGFEFSKSDLEKNISEIPAFSKASIFPNPSAGYVNFQLQTKHATSVQIEVYSVDGKRVKSFDREYLSDGNYLKQWEIGQDIPEGIYHVIFRTNIGDFQEKMVITNTGNIRR